MSAYSRASLFFLLLVACSAGYAADTYVLRESSPATGSHILRPTSYSNIPFDKTYEQLTPEQKAILRVRYVNMPATDDPPFPLEGLGPLSRIMVKAQDYALAKGMLEIYVTVDEKGNADRAEIVRAPTPELGKFAANALLLTKFRPGYCSGKPCAMQYAMEMSFDVK